MKLGLIGNQTPHAQDARIIKALYSAKGRDCRGPRLLIGFRNERGELYRYASLDGHGQELELQRKLDALQVKTDYGEPVLAVFGPI